MVLFVTLGDIIGVILFLCVVGYILYLCLWSARDTHEKRKPYLQDEKKPAPAARTKTDPKTAKALIVLGIFFALAIATAFWAVSK